VPVGIPRGPIGKENFTVQEERKLTCTEEMEFSATILVTLGGLGVGANIVLMLILLVKRPLRR